MTPPSRSSYPRSCDTPRKAGLIMSEYTYTGESGRLYSYLLFSANDLAALPVHAA